MSYPWEDWDYITKIDPDKNLVGNEILRDMYETDTDALEIGGTFGIAGEKVERAIKATPEYDVPIYQEPSNPGVVIDDNTLDGYLIPTVFNTNGSFWVTDVYKEWVRIGDGLDWDRTHTEAYIVLNPESSVAEYTDTDTNQSTEGVASLAHVAEKMFGQKTIYVEHSGTYGDPEKVDAAYDMLDDATLFYGDDVHDYESAYKMSQHVGAAVVGNLLHDESVDAVCETVEDARDATAGLAAEQSHGRGFCFYADDIDSVDSVDSAFTPLVRDSRVASASDDDAPDVL